MRLLKALRTAALLAGSVCNLWAQRGAPGALSGDQVLDRVSPSVVLVLAGRGDGQVATAGTGLIVRADGVVLTTNHAVNGMREVQVRLKNGEVYDRVELIASDERRDVAALRIPATGLPVLPICNSANVKSGASVFAVSTGARLPWTVVSGTLSATRMADDVPGAGSGYRLLEFTAPLAADSGGGALVDAQAQALGIVVAFSPGQNVNFAVTVDSVAGLAAVSGGTPFASGNRLQLSKAPAAATAGTPVGTPAVPPAPSPDLGLPRPEQLPIRTVSVSSKTIHIRRERLQDDLRKNALFGQLALRFADYGQRADVAIAVDRPFLTFDWTYTLVYQPSDLTLASGMIEAVDEFDAGPKLAAQIMEQLAAAAVLPRAALAGSRAALAAREAESARRSPTDPAEVLRTFGTIFVESHTIWMKGSLLQDALFVRPELREWGIRIVDDRNAADIYVDVTRPFLTWDWVYKIISTRTGSVLGTGKIIALDGPAAAPRIAMEVVNRILSARPLPTTKGPG
ncbi:MAG: S1C family serine protease [Acidobacteriota bacterium]